MSSSPTDWMVSWALSARASSPVSSARRSRLRAWTPFPEGRAPSWGPLRRAVAGRLPQPGDGPDKARREAGYFDLLLRAVGEEGQVLRGRVKGDRDPGYGSTSKMLAESAVCLAQDPEKVGGGIWTPASAMGQPLLARMPRAGVTFSIEE